MNYWRVTFAYGTLYDYGNPNPLLIVQLDLPSDGEIPTDEDVKRWRLHNLAEHVKKEAFDRGERGYYAPSSYIALSWSPIQQPKQETNEENP